MFNFNFLSINIANSNPKIIAGIISQQAEEAISGNNIEDFLNPQNIVYSELNVTDKGSEKKPSEEIKCNKSRKNIIARVKKRNIYNLDPSSESEEDCNSNFIL